ncbi:hypothetical protein Pst134EB_016269 [Puccinia striiformis f. sp. tritici]|nr:hypothetical protein Pst134EB_016269 [Puccinia striiformis f. sp. tritici]
MDDDEAFLYGDDAPETTSVGVSKLTSAQPVEPAVHPIPTSSATPISLPRTSAAQLNQPDPPQAVVLDHSQPQSISVAATGLVDEEDGEDDEDAVDEQGILEDSDEDLDIILEGDTSVAPTAPPSRPPTQPMRFDTPRDSVPLGRPIEQLNSTTEYKPFERVDLKLPEPVFAQPPKPSPIIPLPANPSPRHAPRPNNQNRLPTP